MSCAHPPTLKKGARGQRLAMCMQAAIHASRQHRLRVEHRLFFRHRERNCLFISKATLKSRFGMTLPRTPSFHQGVPSLAMGRHFSSVISQVTRASRCLALPLMRGCRISVRSRFDGLVWLVSSHTSFIALSLCPASPLFLGKQVTRAPRCLALPLMRGCRISGSGFGQARPSVPT